jgi:hypothetical protein
MGKQKFPPAVAHELRVDTQKINEREARRIAMKHLFIERVAEYLTTNVAHKSILLQMGKAEGREWAMIANAIPGGNGYDDKAKRIEQLTELLK